MYWAHRVNNSITITAVESFIDAVELSDGVNCTDLVEEHGMDTVQYWLGQFSAQFNSSTTAEILQDIESFLSR